MSTPLLASASGRSVAATARQVGVAPTTVWRWVRQGAQTLNGEKVRLKATKWPGGWRIDPADLEQFLVALNCDEQPETTPPPTERASARPEVVRADQALEASGW